MTALCEFLNAPGRPESPYYSQLAIARGERTVHMAGQVGSDAEGKVVEGGLAAQAERALLNVGLLLDAAEAHLVKLTIYVVDYAPEKFPELGAGLMAARAQREFPQVPITLLGVQSLFEPEQLVEIEGVAVA